MDDLNHNANLGLVTEIVTIASLLAQAGLFGPNQKKERNKAYQDAVMKLLSQYDTNFAPIATACGQDPNHIYDRMAKYCRENKNINITAAQIATDQAARYKTSSVSSTVSSNIVPIVLISGAALTLFLLMRK